MHSQNMYINDICCCSKQFGTKSYFCNILTHCRTKLNLQMETELVKSVSVP